MSKLLSRWDTNTGDLPPASSTQPPTADRGVMMPRRRRTRSQDRAAYIKAERERNKIAHSRYQAVSPDDPDPPPF
ncbi:hypothetical protein MMOR_11880 [Mycolicibacterium moriokaense]|uniref:Uncharacterized protein n=1 Tax=Mycolicibacterium moriokaense TaxID=39691 RepID=A0AAD1H7Y1_9MYCO|nr:hypothetical protein MMOR_11880 [Mycolicibacterium moriokaense]